MDLGLYELYDKDNTGKYAELFWEKLTDVMSSSLLLSSTIRIRPII